MLGGTQLGAFAESLRHPVPTSPCVARFCKLLLAHYAENCGSRGQGSIRKLVDSNSPESEVCQLYHRIRTSKMEDLFTEDSFGLLTSTGAEVNITAASGVGQSLLRLLANLIQGNEVSGSDNFLVSLYPIYTYRDIRVCVPVCA